jgi:hypothetical protein
MSLSVVNAGGSAALNVGTNLLANINLTSSQSAQIEQILSELQTGMISPVEARVQIAGIVGGAQQPSAGPTTTGQTVTGGTQHASGSNPRSVPEPFQSYYELPLPQESLKGALASYNSAGAAMETVFTSFQNVNAHA